MKNLKITALFLLALSPCVFGQSNTSINSKRIPLPAFGMMLVNNDIATSGYGDGSVGHSNFINSGIDNPAKLIYNKDAATMSVNHSNYMPSLVSDMSLSTANMTYKFNNQYSLGFTFNYVRTGEVKNTDANATILGVYRSNQWNSGLRVAKKIGKYSSLGIGVQWAQFNNFNSAGSLSSRVSLQSESRLLTDIGYFYNGADFDYDDDSKMYSRQGHNGDSYSSWGVSISNIGSKISSDYQDATFMPTILRAGYTYNYYVADGQRLSFITQLSKLMVPTPPNYGPNGEIISGTDPKTTGSISAILSSFSDAPGGITEELEEVYLNLGIEYSFYNKFILRTGIFNESRNKGNRKNVSVGFGLPIYKNIDINASYLISISSNDALGNSLRFGFSFKY